MGTYLVRLACRRIYLPWGLWASVNLYPWDIHVHTFACNPQYTQKHVSGNTGVILIKASHVFEVLHANMHTSNTLSEYIQWILYKEWQYLWETAAVDDPTLYDNCHHTSDTVHVPLASRMVLDVQR